MPIMQLYNFFRVYGDIVDQGKSPLQRLRDGDKDGSAEAVFIFLVAANVLVLGLPVLALWFLARTVRLL